MLLIVYAPHFVAGIDFETNSVAPILRRSCAGKTLEEVIAIYSNKEGYEIHMIVTGRIEKIVSKDTGYGAYYDIVVEGRRYGVGKKRPDPSEGDWVTFEATAKNINGRDFYNVTQGTIKKAEAPAAGNVASTTPVKSTYVPESDRQNSITYQSARKDALEFVGMLLSAGKIDVGKLKGADAIGMLETFVDKYTMRFYADTKSLGHAAEEAEESAPVDDEDM